MSSRIEQIIEEIEEYIDSCKFQPLSTTKIIVNKDQLDELLRELRMKTPDEIKRYQKIITNRDGILSAAQQQAESMLSQAEQRTAQLLDQNEIVQTAYERAEAIMQQATDEAQRLVNAAQEESEQMRKAALLYTNDLLVEASGHVEEALHETENKQRMLLSALKNSIQVMRNNREELMIQLEPQSYGAEPVGQTPEQPVQNEGDFDHIPEDAFLKDTE